MLPMAAPGAESVFQEDSMKHPIRFLMSLVIFVLLAGCGRNKSVFN
jgi:hypothetical protein